MELLSIIVLVVWVVVCFIIKALTTAKREQSSDVITEDFEENENIFGCVYYESPKKKDCVIRRLKNMDKTDPKKRERTQDDIWFEENVEKFAVNGYYLAYINKYGYLTDVFLSHLKEPEKNLIFQKLLISVHKNKGFADIYDGNFGNLLFLCAKRFAFLPEVTDILYKDERFEITKNVYKYGRNCAIIKC